MLQNYSACACIYEDFVHQASVASMGKCENGCYNLIPFLSILFLIVFITCLGQNPSLLITLRSVDSGSRSFALGMQNVLCRLLGECLWSLLLNLLSFITCRDRFLRVLRNTNCSSVCDACVCISHEGQGWGLQMELPGDECSPC